MIKIFKKYFIPISLSLIISIGFLISIKHINQPMIAEGDAYSRVVIAKVEKERDIFFNTLGGTWLPIHFSFMVLSLSIFDYPLLVPRLITVIFSLGSIIGIYFYTKNFSSEKVALLSSLLFLLFPLRIYLGTQTLSEPVFIFFLLFSFIFISNEKLSYKEIFISLLFLNIAHGIRYESWIVLPLIWLFIIYKPIGLNKKITYILYSILFPIYWLYLNSINTGNFSTFFNQKYEEAQKYQIPQYFNLNLSFTSWKEKLIKIFPASLILLALLDLKSLLKKITSKDIFYYSIPLYFFTILVAQVFFGTMEWFPTRYLLIPTTFLIPLLASSIYKIGTFLYKLFLKQKLTYKISYLLLSALLVFIIIDKYLHILNYTRLETADWSLLQSYNSQETIEKSVLYSNFTDVIKECTQLCDNFTFFFYEEERRTYLDQGIFYFLNIIGIDLPKSELHLIDKNEEIFIWEKSSFDETEIIKNFETIYENEKFYILKSIQQ